MVAPWLTGMDVDTWTWIKCGFARCAECGTWFPGAHGADYLCRGCKASEEEKEVAQRAEHEKAMVASAEPESAEAVR